MRFEVFSSRFAMISGVQMSSNAFIDLRLYNKRFAAILGEQISSNSFV